MQEGGRERLKDWRKRATRESDSDREKGSEVQKVRDRRDGRRTGGDREMKDV